MVLTGWTQSWTPASSMVYRTEFESEESEPRRHPQRVALGWQRWRDRTTPADLASMTPKNSLPCPTISTATKLESYADSVF